MSEPLWAKSHTQVNAALQRFTAGDDVILDREFFIHDIRASRAHVEGLQRIGILTADEAQLLDHELAALAEDFARGEFVLDARFEDGHSAIEARLTERLGDVGRKVHTGRSRNDQILVATRLWLRERLQELHAHCLATASVCLARAQTEALPMPGYICSAQSFHRPRCGMQASPKPSSITQCSRAIPSCGSMRIRLARLLAMA
jgi:argininosuccinate lyase